jgi:two-component system, sensor histidine kinase and response regulator
MNKRDIMIVDDNPANLKLLEDMLCQQGHEVHSFPLGRLALAAAASHPPDLILLDVNMPEMNGYEVCERLKNTAALSAIPVVFLSALNETQDKVKAFQSGAVDYISKPFQFEEVHARVETHLQLYSLQQALRLHNEQLEAAVAARTRELAQANHRLTILDSSKNDFLRLISHEFRTPLNGVLGVSEIILEGLAASAEARELQQIYDLSRSRILTILDDALLLTQIDVTADQFQAVPVRLGAAVHRAVDCATPFAESNQVTLTPLAEDPGPVAGDECLLVRALSALLETAIKFSEEGTQVDVSQEKTGDSIQLVIESHGKTVPARELPRFFDLFSVSEANTPARDLGLGPAVAYRILQLLGGSLTIANRSPSGIRLTVSFRLA